MTKFSLLGESSKSE